MELLKKVKLLSLKVDGLNNLLKRQWLRQVIWKDSWDIVYFQETHLRKSEERYLKEVFPSIILHSFSQKEGRFYTFFKEVELAIASWLLLKLKDYF